MSSNLRSCLKGPKSGAAGGWEWAFAAAAFAAAACAAAANNICRCWVCRPISTILLQTAKLMRGCSSLCHFKGIEYNKCKCKKYVLPALAAAA